MPLNYNQVFPQDATQTTAQQQAVQLNYNDVFNAPKQQSIQQQSQPVATQPDNSSKLDALVQGAQLEANGMGTNISKFLLENPLSGPALTNIGNGVSSAANGVLGLVNAPFRIGVNTPQSLQQDWEQNYKDTYANPNVQANPLTTELGKGLGGAAMTVPAMYAAGVAGPLEYGIANSVGGGLQNNPGMNNQFFNPVNAVSNGIFSAGLNYVGSKMLPMAGAAKEELSNMLTKSGETEEFANAISDHAVTPSGQVDTGKLSQIDSNAEVVQLAKNINRLMPLIKGSVGGGIGYGIGYLADGKTGAENGALIGGSIMAAPSVLSKMVTGTGAIASMLNSVTGHSQIPGQIGNYLTTQLFSKLAKMGLGGYMDNSGNLNIYQKTDQQQKESNEFMPEGPVQTTGIRD